MRRVLVLLVLLAALPADAAGGRGRWLAPRPPPPTYVAPSTRRVPTPRVGLSDAIRIAGGVYRESQGLKDIGGAMTRNLTDREAVKFVRAMGAGIKAKYGLKVVLVSNQVKIPGLTPYPGSNPGKWDDANGVIYLRKGMPAKKLLTELGHEYGAFLLARKVGGRHSIPRIGESPMQTTHVLDGIVSGSIPP